jgi:serine/threonine-protein kinase
MPVRVIVANMSNSLFPEGTIIDGRYRIVRPLGEGGFARVYEAEHLKLERKAAIKILNYVAEQGDTFYERFVREAKIAANLDHPNVVTIFDFGVVEGRNQPYIAMEALDGHDLHEEITKNGPMSPARALPLLKGALDALGQGHARGIIHKDLKPSNLFLVRPGTSQERLVVVDYGIARLNNDPDGQLTRTGAMSGTPAYLAPEYFQNQSVTPALDVYQMGLIIAETLTGRRVVNAPTPVAIAVAHTSGQHDISQRLRQSPLGPFLHKALRVEPNERFRDAHDMLRALEQVPLPGPEVSFAEVGSSPKHHTPEAFAATAITPSNPATPPLGGPAPGVPPQGGAAPGWTPATPASTPSDPAGTAPGRPGVPSTDEVAPSNPFHAMPPRAATVQSGESRTLFWALIIFAALTLGGFVMIGVFYAIGVAISEPRASIESPESGTAQTSLGAALLGDGEPSESEFPAPPTAPGTSPLNRKLANYAAGHAAIFTLAYMMQFYEATRVNFGGLERGDAVMVPPDMGPVYGTAKNQLERARKADPKRPKLDNATSDYLEQLAVLQPIVDDAHMYYEVNRGFETDGMKGGLAIDRRLMRAWPPFRKAEAQLADLVYANFEAHQRQLVDQADDPTRQKAARLVERAATLMRQARKDPTGSAYRDAVEQYRLVFDDYRQHLTNAGEVSGQFAAVAPHRLLGSSAKNLLQEAQAYPKSLAKNEATRDKNPNIERPMPVAEIQHMTQGFAAMVANQNMLLAD